MTEMIKNLKKLFIACKENNFRPHFLEANFLFYLVLIFFILKIIVLPFYINFPKSIFFAEIASSDIFNLLNIQRKVQGLSSLQKNPQLQNAALLKAQDMLNKNYFGHKSPDGILGWHWIKSVEYDYEKAGENLAIGFIDSEEVHQAWNESELHKKNLLNPDFQDIGVAVLTGNFQGSETTIVVQLFGKPKTNIVEKIILPVEAKTENVIMPEEPIKEEPTDLSSKAWKFLITQYNNILYKITLLIAFILLITLISNLIVIFLFLPDKQKLGIIKAIVPVSVLAICILIILGFIDRAVITSLIPHHLQI